MTEHQQQQQKSPVGDQMVEIYEQLREIDCEYLHNVRKQLKAVNLHPGRVKIVHRQRRVRKREEIQLSENLSNSRDIGSCFENSLIRG